MESVSGQPKSKQELSPEDLEIVKSIEEFNWLSSRDKIFTLLIWRKLKSASPVSLITSSPEAVSEFKSVLKKAHLLSQAGPTITSHMRGLNPGMIYYVANNQPDLDLLPEVWFGDHEKDPHVYRSIGRMCGFPQTAIDLYDKFTKLDGMERTEIMQKIVLSPLEKAEKIKEEKMSPEVLTFALLFYMSRDNYQEELKTAQRWADEIKLVSPKIFNQFVHTSEK